MIAKSLRVHYRAKTYLAAILGSFFVSSGAPLAAPASHGYVFVSNGVKLREGGARGVLQPGVGFEWFGGSGLGVGIETGPLFEDYSFSRFDALLISADAVFRPSEGNVVPFLAAGYSLALEPVSDGDQTHLLNFGVAVHWWLRPTRGLRFEVRDHITLGRPQTGYHYVSFGIGYVWRGQSSIAQRKSLVLPSR